MKENREIKFRIPHFNSDRSFAYFTFWGTIDYKECPSLDHDTFTSPSQSSGTTKGWHEQYVGLKNKIDNGVYEGDIVTTKHQPVAVVVWDAPNYCFATKTIDDIVKEELMYCLSDIECVKGNIHENPVLLAK